MRTITAFLLLALMATLSARGQLTVSPVESKITFRVKNLGVAVDGTFSEVEGIVALNNGRSESTLIELSVKAATINTGIALRDDHLRKKGYLDVNHHPVIRFVATTATKTEKGLSVRGNLTIKGITHPITTEVRATETKGGVVFEGSFDIDRTDFSVGVGAFTISDTVSIQFYVVAINSEKK